METIVYLIKSAKELPQKAFREYNVNETLEERKKKQILSATGELQAKKLAKSAIFENVRVIYTSAYVSAVGSAKYLAEERNIPLNVDELLNERKIGTIDDKNNPLFLYREEHDFDSKEGGAESVNEAKERFKKIFEAILFTHTESQIAIFTHEKVIMAFLLNYLEPKYNLEDKLILTFKAKNFPAQLNEADGFKLTFEGSEIINIDKIELE